MRGALSSLSLMLACASTATALAAQPREPFRGLDAFVTRMMAAQRVPGLSLAIVRNDSVLYTKGYGVRKAGADARVDSATLFGIGSSTKAFTATLVAMMVSEGRMDFDDKVSKHLPGFALADPYASAEVTIRDALAHRTSLSRADNLWSGSTFSREEILRRFRYNEPTLGFRSRFVYNNVMLMAAGEAAARAAGTTWDDLVRERLLVPLRMSSTTTSIRPLQGDARFASPHTAGPDGPVPVDAVNIDNIAPAGSLNSNALDMAQWLRFQLGNGAYAGKRLLSEAAFRETHTPQMIVPGRPRHDTTAVFNTYGMGWWVEQYRSQILLQHGGEIGGFTTMVAMLPDQHIGVAVLSNATSTVPTLVMKYVFDQQLRAPERDWVAETPRRPRAPAASSVSVPRTSAKPPLPLTAYAGTYTNQLYGDLVVAVDGDDLVLTREGKRWSGKLEYVNATNFRWRLRGGPGLIVTFDVTPDDQVIALVQRFGAEKITYTRAARSASAVQTSPRLRALVEQLERGDRTALVRFWEEVRRGGAPLVEPITGDTANVLVTFLYRGDSTTRNVLLWRGVNVSTNLADNPLALLPGTDVWYRSYAVRRDARFTYLIGANIDLEAARANFMRALASFTLDPLNPLRDPAIGDPVPKRPPPYYAHSAVELPGAPPQPWVVRNPSVPAGRVEESTFASTLMKNEREIAVYTPAGHTASNGPYDLLIVFDGDWYRTLVPTPTILDNLIAAGRIPPVVAVFVNNPGASRGTELHCNRVFVDFLATELVPWVAHRYAISDDPARTTVAGSSAGGLASSCAALFHPERFGNVLSQSGAYWWAPQGEPPEWALRQFAASSKLPVRFYIDAGLLENTTSILTENRRFRDMLRSRGYEVHYAEFNGGHEYRNWRGTLSDGLIALHGGRASKAGAKR